MNKIELLEYIREFREKNNNDKLIIFVGAGVSCNVANMPSWNTLIQEMANAIKYSKCTNCRKKEKNCEKTCKFIDSFSTDEYLKVPQYVYNRSKKLYNKVLIDNIQHDPTIDAPLSNAIIDLAPSHIITTNYDKLIENCKNIQKDNYEVIIHDKDLLNAIKNRYIIKMHGDIDDPETIVLKESDYLEYTQKHVLIEMFIKSLLTDHTILFLGYSLNDYNVKLIISWINYIRTQNKALDKTTKFAYIVLDEQKIPKNQFKYFESNNIGVVNLNKMPVIENIPDSLTNNVGKRLYSFLRIIKNPSFEKVFGRTFLLEEAISFMRQYKYIDCKNLCNLLCLKQYHIEGYELFIHLDSEYDNLIEFLKTDNEDSRYLQQLFKDAGIYYIRLISTSDNRREDYKITATNISLLCDKFYSEYLKNDYLKLSAISNINVQTMPFESYFYLSLIRDYTSQIFEGYNNLEYITLVTDDKVRYLFNQSVLESRRTYRHNGQTLKKYIDHLQDIREKQIFSLYTDLFEGNHKRLQEIQTSLNKLKEQYYDTNHTFIGCSSLSEFYKIRRIAIEQYLFYFENTLFFRGFTDIKKILKPYIESILCTNGNFIDVTTASFGFRSVKERYAIDKIDFDIITKFITIKDLNNLIKQYSIANFKVSEEIINHAITCFDNLANFIITQKIYHRFFDAPNNLINCAILLSHFPLNDAQKSSIRDVVVKLFSDEDFITFLFSIEFPSVSQSIHVLHDLLKVLSPYHSLDIVDRILHSEHFADFYVNTNTRKVRDILSFFICNTESKTSQEKIYNIIMSFDGRERIFAIRLLYKHIIAEKYINCLKDYLKENFNILDSNDIYDFAFDDWLEITEEHRQEMLSKAVSIYKEQQTSAMHSYPDPLETQLELIYILYITEKISDIESLREIIEASEFLHFFLDPNSFDYHKIDFSNYMWENIARHQKFMDIILNHKEDIIPNLKQRVESNQATEFERKILYGYLMDKSELM